MAGLEEAEPEPRGLQRFDQRTELHRLRPRPVDQGQPKRGPGRPRNHPQTPEQLRQAARKAERKRRVSEYKVWKQRQALAEADTLPRFAQRYALWLVRETASRGRRPTKPELWRHFRQMASAKLNQDDLTAFLEREDFQELVITLRSDHEAQAKAMIQDQMPEVVKSHFEAIEKLQNQKRYGDLAKFTLPYLERAYPTKSEPVPTVLQPLQIVIGGGFASRYLQPKAEAETEIIIEAVAVPAPDPTT